MLTPALTTDWARAEAWAVVTYLQAPVPTSSEVGAVVATGGVVAAVVGLPAVVVSDVDSVVVVAASAAGGDEDGDEHAHADPQPAPVTGMLHAGPHGWGSYRGWTPNLWRRRLRPHRATSRGLASRWHPLG